MQWIVWLKITYDVAKEYYKNYLIKTGTFNEEQFEEKVKALITSNPRIEDDLALHVKGIEIQVRNLDARINKVSIYNQIHGKAWPD